MAKKTEKHKAEWVYDYADKMIEAKDVVGCIFLLYATEIILRHRPEKQLMQQQYDLSMQEPSAATAKALKSLPKALDERINEALGEKNADSYYNLLGMLKSIKEMLEIEQLDKCDDYILSFLERHVRTHYLL
jgi:hypothetical protein